MSNPIARIRGRLGRKKRLREKEQRRREKEQRAREKKPKKKSG